MRDPFLACDLSREEARRLIARAHRETGGSNKRILDFLRNHDLRAIPDPRAGGARKDEEVPMSRRLILVLTSLAAALIAIAVMMVVPRSATAQERRPRPDVVLIRCDVGSSGFRVTGYSGSTSAPTKKSDNCAETISQLGEEGFSLQDARSLDVNDGSLVYLLER